MITFVGLLKRNEEFRKVWIGYTLSLMGNWFTTIAVNMYVWNAYESTVLTSLSLAINLIPTVCFGPLLGRFVDIIDKKKLAIALNIFNILVLFVPIISSSIYMICLFNFLNGIISCVRYPWLNSYIPLIVEADDLLESNSAISASKTSGQLIIPVLSGMLLSIVSVKLLYLFNIVFLLISTFCFFNLNAHENNLYRSDEKTDNTTIINILMHVWKDNKLKTICILMMLMLFLDGILNVFLIVVVKDVFQKSDYYYGVATALQALGMLSASISVSNMIKRYNKSLIKGIHILGLIKIVMILCMTYSANYIVFFIFVYCEAYSWTTMTITENMILQSSFPMKARAGFFAVYGALCWLASFCGTLFYGFFADFCGSTKAVTIILIIIFIGWMCNISRSIGTSPSSDQ